MFDFQITQVAINGYHHTFSELVATLGHSAASLGLRTRGRMVVAHEAVDVITDAAVNVLVGDLAYTAPLLRDAMAGKPFVVWQLEPLASSVGLASTHPQYLALLRKAVRVWDYNVGNIATLREWGVTRTALLPFGHHRVLETVPQVSDKDIDVCFFGCLTKRRREVLSALEQCGLVIVAREKCYGAERDALIGRSRIALNVHGYDGLPVLEEARLSFLLANRCFVVSEESDHNPYGDGVIFAPYDRIVETCRHWLAQPSEARLTVAGLGYAALRRRPFLDSLSTAYRDARAAVSDAMAG